MLRNRPLLVFALAYIIWGINTPLIKLGLESMPLGVFISLKFGIAAVLTVPFLIKHWQPVKFRLLLRIFIATLFGYVLSLFLLYEGLKHTSGSSTALIYTFGPVLLFALSIEVLKERFNAKILFGLIVSGVGTLVVVFSPALTDQVSSVTLFGNTLIVLAVLADVIGTILIKPALKRVKSEQITLLRLTIAAAVFVMFSLPALTSFDYSTITATGYITLFYGLVVGVLIGQSLYHYGLSRIQVEQASVLNYLDPIFGVIASIIILHEQLTTAVLVGAALTFWGIYIAEARLRHGVGLLHHQRH